MEYKEKILTVINTKNLTTEEVDLWHRILNAMSEKLYPDVLWVLENAPDGVERLTKNAKEMTDALVNHDLVKWESLLEQEKTYLNSLQR